MVDEAVLFCSSYSTGKRFHGKCPSERDSEYILHTLVLLFCGSEFKAGRGVGGFVRVLQAVS